MDMSKKQHDMDMTKKPQQQLDEEYYQRLHELQSVDFVLVELQLFLDTHPQDMQALQQFNHYAHVRKKLVSEFEVRYGPLLQFGNSTSEFPWQWIEAPWPWQV